MRPIIIIGIVAALAAGGTAMLAKSWLDRQEARRAKAADEPATVEIMIISRDIPSGAALVSDDLRYEAWPKAAVSSRLAVRKPGEDAKAAFVGMIARRPPGRGRAGLRRHHLPPGSLGSPGRLAEAGHAGHLHRHHQSHGGLGLHHPR